MAAMHLVSFSQPLQASVGTCKSLASFLHTLHPCNEKKCRGFHWFARSSVVYRRLYLPCEILLLFLIVVVFVLVLLQVVDTVLDTEVLFPTRLHHFVLRRLNLISEINDEKETWKIVVRVINLWTIPRSSRHTVELILMDKEGGKILAQMKNVDMGMVKDTFEIGQIYIVQNFEVEKNSGHYKATNHAFKINLIKATKITPHDLPEMPLAKYSFTKFDSILDGSATPDYLIDVIGEIIEIGHWNLDGKPKKVSFTMKDECGTDINCTLWEEHAIKLKECFDKHKTGPVVLVITMAKIKEARGPYPISIQNSMYGSQIFVNSSMKEIIDFRDRLMTLMDPTQSTLVSYTQTSSQISGSSQYSNGDRFLHNAKVHHLFEIAQLKKECMVVTVGTIQKLLIANGWVYDACPKCNKKVESLELPVICGGCGNQSAAAMSRYRIDVRVTQQSESAIFTLWDRDSYALIKESADDIIKKIIAEEGEFDARDVPEALDRMLGKTLAFRFKFVPGNKRHSVSQISEDEMVVSSVLSQLSTIEDEADLSISMPHQTNEQTFSASCDSDGNLNESITPAKRNLVPSDSELDITAFEDLSQIEMSSTKMGKHIKTE